MLLTIMQLYVPEFIKQKKLDELFRLTAAAFRSQPPELGGFSFSERLAEYALFTREQAERCLQDGYSLAEVKCRLYQNAFAFGQDLRRSLRITTREEAAMALKLMYRLIGIDFRCDRQGKFIIRQCFFSRYYSAAVCRLISALDEGLAAGLAGGGRLCFEQRLTDGGSCCQGNWSGV